MGHPHADQFSQAYRDPNILQHEQAVVDCVQEILHVATTYLGKPASELSVLDCGSGTGQYLFETEKSVRKIMGIEPDLTALKHARLVKEKNGSKAVMLHGFIEETPIDEKFDLIISLTTVEHMPDARKSMEHIVRLLKPGGIIYLTAPNKLWPIECHYQLPFLSYLPLPLANLYMQITGKGRSYQDCSYARTYWGMKRLFKGLDCKVTFIVPDENSKYVGLGDTNIVRNLVRRVGLRLIKRFSFFWIISKGFFMVIQKNTD